MCQHGRDEQAGYVKLEPGWLEKDLRMASMQSDVLDIFWRMNEAQLAKLLKAARKIAK